MRNDSLSVVSGELYRHLYKLLKMLLESNTVEQRLCTLAGIDKTREMGAPTVNPIGL